MSQDEIVWRRVRQSSDQNRVGRIRLRDLRWSRSGKFRVRLLGFTDQCRTGRHARNGAALGSRRSLCRDGLRWATLVLLLHRRCLPRCTKTRGIEQKNRDECQRGAEMEPCVHRASTTS
jgi:hypothetical protein